MIYPLMVSSKNVEVSQKRCLGTSIESFTGSSPSEQIIIHEYELHILSNRNVGGTKDHGKNYIKVRPPCPPSFA